MSELCRREAQTIHRALGMTYNELTGETVFKKNGKEPLEADAVIVDEMSMVDLPLMQALLEAVKPGCRLVMVGDPDQLPSVGPGNVLGDLLRSHAVAAVSLTEVFRQAERSAIIRNAHAVNSGRPPELGSGQNDFFSCAAGPRTVWCRRWWTCAALACRTTWGSPPIRSRCCPPPAGALPAP